jgi:hypothetical protein
VPPPQPEQLPEQEPEPEPDYDVERVVAYERRDDGIWLKIRWLDYAAEHDTWEPLHEVCEGAREMVEEFMIRESIFWVTLVAQQIGPRW